MKKVFTISIIILLVAGGVWFYLSQDKNIDLEVKDEHNVVSDDDQKDGIIDTSEWVTYRNEEFGFSFSYPKSWDLYNESDNYVSFNYSQTYLSTEFKLLIRENPNRESVYDFYNNIDENKKIEGNKDLIYNWYESSNNKTKTIYVDGTKAINFISPMGIIENTAIAMPKDDIIVEIQIIGFEEIEIGSVYEVILNSWKFIK